MEHGIGYKGGIKMDIETYALAKAYTDKEVAGGGAIKGKNCVITEIEDVGNTHIVHFQWTLDDGTVETDTMTVEDGDLVEASETNGNIKINGVETQVYDDTEIKADIDAIDDIISTDEVTKEGNPLNFTTLSAQNAKSTILSLEPIQDLHGYPNPWTGGTGKNKFDGVVELGTIGSNGEDVPSDNRCRSKNHIPVKPNTTYIFSINGISKNTNWVFYDGTKTKIDGMSGETFTTPNNCYYVRWFYDLTLYQQTNYQLEVGSSPTSFAPYENICPIFGRSEIGILGCGKNLIPLDITTIKSLNTGGTWSGNVYSFRGIVFTLITDSDNNVTAIKVNGATDEPVSFITFGTLSIPNGTYKVNGCPDGGAGNTYSILIQNNWDGSTYEDVFCTGSSDVSFTVTTGQIRLYGPRISGNTTVNNLIFYPMIRKSTESDSNFEPYTKSNDLTISLGQTVYGCHYSVEKGELVVDRAIVDLGSRTYEKSDDGYFFFRTNDFNFIPFDTSNPYAISEIYPLCTYIQWYNRSIEYGMVGINVNHVIYIADARYATEQGIKDGLNGVQLCYKLATPITIQLTPNEISLLEGVNNISTDGDKITLTYRDGSVATLGDLTSAVDNLDSKIEDSKILTDTATGDKYILVVTNGVLSVEQVSD